MSVSVKDRIVEIIAKQVMMDPSELTLAATPEELGIDSMALVETIFSIEESFDIQVPFNANDPQASGFDITNVGSIIAAVEALVAEQAP